MPLKEKVKKAARGSILYSPLRDAYHYLFNRRYWAYRTAMLSLFSKFVSRDDLVFDVGANVGEYTELFVKLGARVVAVEPNPSCAALLRTIQPVERVSIECVALGSSQGSADLHLCQSYTLSTLSQEWMTVAKRSERFSGIEWQGSIEVKVSTLDALIEKYGTPQYIKIDVEGFEENVLRGLTRAPRLLSFEFNTESIEAGAACLKQDCFSSDARFNLIFERSAEFFLERWVSRDEMLRFLGQGDLGERKTFGDIFVHWNG